MTGSDETIMQHDRIISLQGDGRTTSETGTVSHFQCQKILPTINLTPIILMAMVTRWLPV